MDIFSSEYIDYLSRGYLCIYNFKVRDVPTMKAPNKYHIIVPNLCWESNKQVSCPHVKRKQDPVTMMEDDKYVIQGLWRSTVPESHTCIRCTVITPISAFWLTEPVLLPWTIASICINSSLCTNTIIGNWAYTLLSINNLWHNKCSHIPPYTIQF